MKIFRKKKMMRIRTYGDKVLKSESKNIESVDAWTRELADKMITTMQKSDGVGLAAPQVGENIRLIVLGVPYDEERTVPESPGELQLLPQMPLVLINPTVTPAVNRTVCAEEGCLSIPNIYAKVVRHERVMLSAQLLSGHPINVECGGFLSRALQHEIDHLDGILFVDRLDETEKGKIASKLEELKNK